MKVVIIEDEEYTAKDLVSTLLQCNAQIEIAAVLDSVESAKKYFKNGQTTAKKRLMGSFKETKYEMASF